MYFLVFSRVDKSEYNIYGILCANKYNFSHKINNVRSKLV